MADLVVIQGKRRSRHDNPRHPWRESDDGRPSGRSTIRRATRPVSNYRQQDQSARTTIEWQQTSGEGTQQSQQTCCSFISIRFHSLLYVISSHSFYKLMV